MKKILSLVLAFLVVFTAMIPCLAAPIFNASVPCEFLDYAALRELNEDESVDILSCSIVSEDEEFTCIEVSYATNPDNPFDTGTTGCRVRHIWTKNGTEILYLDFIPWFNYDYGVSATFDTSTFNVYIQVTGSSCSKTSLTYTNTTSSSGRARATQYYVLSDASGNVRYGSAIGYCDVYGNCSTNGGVFSV